jgi:hypothetical protein
MVEKSEKKKRKLKGVMKGLKRKPKPGSYDYQLQETMKPIYKTPPAMKKGELVNRPGVAPKKPNGLGVPDKFKKFKPSPTLPKQAKKLGSAALKAARATRIGKIAAGVAGAALAAKAGLEKLYEKRTGKKPFTKRPDKKMGGGMMMRRPMMASEGRFTNRDVQAAKDALKIKKVKPGDRGYKMIQRSLDTIKSNKKMDKKMGGGLTEATRRLRAQGLRTGGMCRGMGAAIRGGDFKGVK